MIAFSPIFDILLNFNLLESDLFKKRLYTRGMQFAPPSREDVTGEGYKENAKARPIVKNLMLTGNIQKEIMNGSTQEPAGKPRCETIILVERCIQWKAIPDLEGKFGLRYQCLAMSII